MRCEPHFIADLHGASSSPLPQYLPSTILPLYSILYAPLSRVRSGPSLRYVYNIISRPSFLVVVIFVAFFSASFFCVLAFFYLIYNLLSVGASASPGLLVALRWWWWGTYLPTYLPPEWICSYILLHLESEAFNAWTTNDLFDFNELVPRCS